MEAAHGVGRRRQRRTGLACGGAARDWHVVAVRWASRRRRHAGWLVGNMGIRGWEVEDAGMGGFFFFV